MAPVVVWIDEDDLRDIMRLDQDYEARIEIDYRVICKRESSSNQNGTKNTGGKIGSAAVNSTP